MELYLPKATIFYSLCYIVEKSQTMCNKQQQQQQQQQFALVASRWVIWGRRIIFIGDKLKLEELCIELVETEHKFRDVYHGRAYSATELKWYETSTDVKHCNQKHGAVAGPFPYSLSPLIWTVCKLMGMIAIILIRFIALKNDILIIMIVHSSE